MLSADARRSHLHHEPPRPPPNLPFSIDGAQYIPLSWGDVAGWADDDLLAGFRAFRASCSAIVAQTGPVASNKPLSGTLREPCRAASAANVSTAVAARAFFEAQFQPVRISRLGDTDGFVTGYYEPIVDGSRTRTDVYTVPVYRRPSNLFVRGYRQDAPDLPNKGSVYRKIGRRKLVPYYDRAQIEDGAIAGRGLELCWLKSQIDLLFMQIQGSARIRFEDGSMMRLNYDAHNGYPYTAVGRLLIERNIIPKEQMSMQRIRQWMEENPDGANELRRQNRAYVFFREVPLSATEEAVGAQGVHLTPGRSIAVDKALHVYGTPFFIMGDLPLESEQSKSSFRHLMVAQDTGSAIVGPARADIYFGAGPEAGRVSGRLRHNVQFVMLVPKSLDPIAHGETAPFPAPRPAGIKSVETRQADAKPAPAKTLDAKQSDTKPAAAKSAETQSSEAKPADAKAEPKHDEPHRRHRRRHRSGQ